MIDQLESRRMLSAGEVDLAFGADGVTSLIFGRHSQNDAAITSMSDGKLLVVGAKLDGGYELIRLSQGRIDKTFGDHGYVFRTGDEGGFTPRAIAVNNTTGRILVSGLEDSLADTQPLDLDAYLPDGTLDTSFGDNGHKSFNIDNGFWNETQRLSFQSDGKILVSYSKAAHTPGDFSNAVLERLKPDGTPDGSFGNTGVEVFPSIQAISSLEAVGSSILIGGSYDRNDIDAESDPINERHGYAVMKLRSDGTLDPSFGDAIHHQIADQSLDGPFELTNLAMAPDGSLYLMIYNFRSNVPDVFPEHILYHYDAAGTHVLQQRAFPGGESVPFAEDMGLEADGHVVVVGEGSSNDVAFVMQLKSDLTTNTSFGDNGMSEFGVAFLPNHVLLPADNSIIMYGQYGFADNGAAIQEFRLRRFLGGAEAGHAEPGESALNRPVGILDAVGTTGNDQIILSRHGSQIFVQMNGVVQRYPATKVFTVMIRSGAGNDQVVIGNGVPGAYVLGGDGNDTLQGGDGNDSLTGEGGRDLILGGAGDDLLNGSGANDTISGQNGNDRVFGGGGNDSLFGGKGDDHVAGADGDDFLEGDSGADWLEDFYGQNRVSKDSHDNVQVTD